MSSPSHSINLNPTGTMFYIEEDKAGALTSKALFVLQKEGKVKLAIMNGNHEAILVTKHTQIADKADVGVKIGAHWVWIGKQRLETVNGVTKPRKCFRQNLGLFLPN